MTTKRRQSSSYSDELSRYEFVDYTSVSSFEKFITMMEETLYSWGIKDGSYGIYSDQHLSVHNKAMRHQPSSQEFTRTETLVMGEDNYQLTYYCQPLSEKEDKKRFPLAAQEFYHFGHTTTAYHPLHRWTGHERILVLKQNSTLKKKLLNAAAVKQTSIDPKQMISACAIAFQNVECRVPVFVPVGPPRHDMYIGYMLNTSVEETSINETEVRWNMSVTTPPTSQLAYLDGLKTLFLQKLSVRYEDEEKQPNAEENVWCSAVYTYHLKNWFDENWKLWQKEEEPIKKRNSFDDDFESWGDEDDVMQQETKSNSKNQYLQFGSLNDPLRSLTLSALFPLCQDELFDDQYQTNIDALTAKQWQLSREFAPLSQQRAYLSTLFEQVITSWIKDPTNKEFLQPYDGNNDESTNDSLNMMRNLFVPMNAGISIPAIQPEDQVHLFKMDQIETVLQELFYLETAADDSKEIKKLISKMKSTVPYQSLLWKLFFYSLNQVTSSMNFLGFLKVIWIQVLKKIRWHWENLIPIPNLNPYLYDDNESKVLGIDLRFNILHQKLSMVNCCIVRKLQSADLTEKQEPVKESKDEDEEDDDVFVDAIEEEEQVTEEGDFISLKENPSINTVDELESIQDDNKIEGVHKPHATLKLLNSDKPMHIPITQEPGFMTEDMISEQVGYFEKLGTSDDATQKRAKLQSAQLLSDMEAFKAANALCCLEDFVRWYSPKDFEDGKLSLRMSEPNNVWKQLWNTSNRIPCSRQKPLFDINTEAEKALYFLETTTVHELFSIMLPTVSVVCYDTLLNHPIIHYSKLTMNGLHALANELAAFPWDQFTHGKTTIQSIISLIRQQETLMCHAISLLRKLPDQYDLVDQLLFHDHAIVKEGNERASVFQLFKNDQGIISKPSFREYVLYSDCKELTANDRALPSRQYAIVKDNEIRIMDMHTIDALYL